MNTIRQVYKAVIPAAGMGTRFLPATKAQPKEMLPIVDTPTIQFVVEEAVRSGIRDILIITGKDKRSIEDHFDRNADWEKALDEERRQWLDGINEMTARAQIHYVRQGEQKGLGHAILQARWHVDREPFVVLLGDTLIDSEVPCTRQLMDLFAEKQAPVIGLEQVAPEKVSRYGIIAGRQEGPRTYRLTDLVEKPERDQAPSALAIGGRYILTPDIFDILENTPAGKNGEIQLTDALRSQVREQTLWGYHFEGKRYDIGNRLDYLITQVEYALRRPDLRQGFEPYLRELWQKMQLDATPGLR